MNRRRTAFWAPLLMLLALLSVAVGAEAQGSGGVSLTVHAGWNLLAVPTGTILPASAGPAYALGPGTLEYQRVGSGEAVGGRAVWVYFSEDTTLTLGRSAADYSRVQAPPNRYVLAGNPATDRVESLAGADVAYTYDQDQGYVAVTELAPGQGAFVLSRGGGTITVGPVPQGERERVIRDLQVMLSDRPLERAAIERVAGVAAEMVRTRDYAGAQALMDDMRAAEEDGVHKHTTAPLPPISRLEQESLVTVREAVAKAQQDAAEGDTASADAELARAQQAAQAAEDDGIALAKGGGGHAAVYDARNTAEVDQGAAIAASGALLRASFLAIGLGKAPSETVWTLVVGFVSGQLQPPPVPNQGGASSMAPPAPPPPPPTGGAAGTQSCDVDAGHLSLDGEEQAMLAAVNAYRAANGLPSAQLAPSLERAAAWKAQDMVTRHSYGHDDGFRSAFERFRDCGYTPLSPTMAENLNGGNPSAAIVFREWQSDSSHNTNLLNPTLQYVGIKRWQATDANAPYSWVWVMEFGSEPDPS